MSENEKLFGLIVINKKVVEASLLVLPPDEDVFGSGWTGCLEHEGSTMGKAGIMIGMTEGVVVDPEPYRTKDDLLEAMAEMYEYVVIEEK